MTTSTNKLIDIDAEFDDVEFDETNIKRRTFSLEMHQNPTFKKEWLEKNIDKNKDPEIRAKLSISQLESWQDQTKSQSRLNGQKEYWSKEESKDKAKQKHSGKVFMDSILKRSTPSFNKSISEGKKQPIHVPWGDFPSMRDAINEGKKLGIKNTTRLVPRSLKEDPENFYLIKK